MGQILAVLKNTFLQTVRQPIFGIIVLVTLGGLSLAPSFTGWTLDNDDKMLRDIGLSTLLIQGLFLACFSASAVINTEIEDRTVLASAAKPIDRAEFIAGKYLGVLAAVTAAHYLAGLAFFMVMRHGVLQTSADTSDPTVLVFGPGAMLVVMIAAGVANYVFEWRFLPTMLALAVAVGTLGTAVMLVVDRDWKLRGYETTQTMDNLPAEAAQDGALGRIIEFRPLPGHGVIEGNRGHLVRKNWQGPISDRDREYLLGLSDSLQWRRDVDFLVQSTRKLQGMEVFKAAILVLGAVALLASIAVAVSTRLGIIATLVACILAIGIGLTVDHFLLPVAQSSSPWASSASWAYSLIPNFQIFWMIDALSEDRLIPWSYIGRATLYCIAFIAAFLALGAAMFETREVG